MNTIAHKTFEAFWGGGGVIAKYYTSKLSLDRTKYFFVSLRDYETSERSVHSQKRASCSKARFPLGEFVRATRSENKNPAT